MTGRNYQEESLAGATGVELVVALYDASIRFLYRAIQSVEEEDVYGRRLAVKKTLDIFMYLQARLRPDVGGAPAKSLDEFYTAMFTMTLEASHFESVEQFKNVIACVLNVRDAWVVAARDPEASKVLPRELRTREERFLPAGAAPVASEAGGSRWSA
jgi:flagellar secretion chaperone FliS